MDKNYSAMGLADLRAEAQNSKIKLLESVATSKPLTPETVGDLVFLINETLARLGAIEGICKNGVIPRN